MSARVIYSFEIVKHRVRLYRVIWEKRYANGAKSVVRVCWFVVCEDGMAVDVVIRVKYDGLKSSIKASSYCGNPFFRLGVYAEELLKDQSIDITKSLLQKAGVMKKET